MSTWIVIFNSFSEKFFKVVSTAFLPFPKLLRCVGRFQYRLWLISVDFGTDFGRFREISVDFGTDFG